jgi:hypothetical protein
MCHQSHCKECRLVMYTLKISIKYCYAFLGGCDSLVKCNGNGTLDKMLNNEEYSDKPNYDYG